MVSSLAVAAGRVVAGPGSVKLAGLASLGHVGGMAREQLSRVGEIVRRHDPDRFFTALFAPAEHRDTLFTLYAFNHELARAREATREPVAALIRLQWWREVVEGARRRHEVAEPLGTAIDAGALRAADLLPLVDAREAEVEAMPDVPAFTSYIQDTAGSLMVVAARVLGWGEAESLRDRGAAYGVVGVLRNAAALERAGRCLLPPGDASRATLEALASTWLGRPRTVPRRALAAALPAVLARRRLRHTEAPVRDRLAVLMATVTARA